MQNENSDLVQLKDENDKDVNFQHILTVEHKGSYYVVLEAAEDTDDCKEGEAIILKIVHDTQTDEDVYATIEDEAEFNAVFDKCLAAMEEEDDEDVDLTDLEALDGDDGDPDEE
ncbi:MAG: DUF1292 domain-containing protein [Clostridia bacterium]